MAITPVQPAAIERYFAVGVTQTLFATTVANPAAPTFAELDGATELTRDTQDMADWMSSSEFIETPDWASRFVGKIPGLIKAGDPTVTFYQSKNQVDIRSVLPRDTEGFIIIAWGGLATGKGDVYHVKVGSNIKVPSATEAALLRVSFAVLEEPNEDVTLPQS